MIKGTINRFECDIAVIEVEEHSIEYPKHLLPPGTEVGDVVVIEGNRVLVDKQL
ncbi:DUF3006 domain-containing protein [Paenibacillus taiwanensis]|uniref:DUF3006 domain-containing protein n=1 Tax=Paenibacillus taiwanensis TaxID=401638 RepID=UPI0004151BA8|nr:DUF3006 domain-containing protein [Paenibacillus taiwanensis]